MHEATSVPEQFKRFYFLIAEKLQARLDGSKPCCVGTLLRRGEEIFASEAMRGLSYPRLFFFDSRRRSSTGGRGREPFGLLRTHSMRGRSPTSLQRKRSCTT